MNRPSSSCCSTNATHPGTPTKVTTHAPIISSGVLFDQDRREVLIEHRGAFYRLRLTKQGKLILTK